MSDHLKIAFFLIGIIFVSCALSDNQQEEIIDLAIVGHAYGNPDQPTGSLYPPLLEKHQRYFDQNSCDYLIFTGDVVKEGSEEEWRKIEREVLSLNVGTARLAPGNHDQGRYLKEQLQPNEYGSFSERGNLFLMFNTTRPGWNLDHKQQLFLKRKLENDSTFHQIFVFTHQLWWLKDKPAEIDSILPNSYALYDDSTSFWTDIIPVFRAADKPVYFFAGDLGCCKEIGGYYEDHWEQFHFYASGVGNGITDNFLHLQIFQDSTVKIDRIDF